MARSGASRIPLGTLLDRLGAHLADRDERELRSILFDAVRDPSSDVGGVVGAGGAASPLRLVAG